MKIAVINIDDSLGGASMACIRLSEAISKVAEVDVLVQKKTLDKPIIKQIDSGRMWRLSVFLRFVIERLYFYFFEKSKEIRFAFSPAVIGTDVTAKVDLNQYDIIHLHWTNFGFLSLKGLKRIMALKKPVVWSMHDMWAFTGGCHYSNDCMRFEQSCGNCVQYLKSPEENDLSHKLLIEKTEVYGVSRKMHFVGSSKWLANLGKKSSILKNHEVSNIPTVVSQNFKQIDKLSARKELRLPLNSHLILFVAIKISDKRKGFNYLKEALLTLKKENQNTSDIELVVLGNTEGLEEQNLPFETHLLGRISNPDILNKVYNAADVFVIPSLQDNLPNTVMEALATGTPSVGFNVGGIPEMIDHKETGYLAEYKSSESLSKGIQWVLENDSYQNLIENCIEKAKNEYSADVVAKKYLALYQKILS